MNLSQLIQAWLDRIGKLAVPISVITALNFGIFESGDGYILYLTGSKVYDEEDDDWATKIDFEASRTDKYLILPSDITIDKQWDEVLGLVSSALKDVTEKNSEHPTLKGKIITTGFDDGNLVRIV